MIPSAPRSSEAPRRRRKCRSLIPSNAPASTQLNFFFRCSSIASVIRAILTSGSMRSLRRKPDRSCAPKPGHISCQRHTWDFTEPILRDHVLKRDGEREKALGRSGVSASFVGVLARKQKPLAELQEKPRDYRGVVVRHGTNLTH